MFQGQLLKVGQVIVKEPHAPVTSSQLKEENKGARAPSFEWDQRPIEGRKR